MHLNSNMSACEQAPVSQFGSSAHGSLLRAKSQFEEVNTLDIEKTKLYYKQIRSGDLCDCCRNYGTWIWLNFVVTSLYRHSSHNREFHNVNWQILWCGSQCKFGMYKRPLTSHSCRVGGWKFHPPLIKPCMRFSLTRLSDILLSTALRHALAIFFNPFS